MASSIRNRRIVLNSRPHGSPSAENFRLEDSPLGLGDVMVGSTISRVEQSNNPDYFAGELVLANSGWQDFEMSNGTGLTKLNGQFDYPTMALSVLGMTGFTAYLGLLEIGRPREGDTVVVAAASGPVGSIVGQIARIHGCHVVGIAGGQEKCSYVFSDLGFSACIDRHAPDFAQQLAAACPNGIDVYFENVGGIVFEAVLPLLNTFARVPICGLVSGYNGSGSVSGPDRLGEVMGMILAKRIKMQGFIVGDDNGLHFSDFFTNMTGWLKEGKIRFREDIEDGLENAPKALMDVLDGKNFGKKVVRVATA